MAETPGKGAEPSHSWTKFLDYQTRRRTAVLMGLTAFGAAFVASEIKAEAAEGPTVLRINAGGPAVTTGGVAWAADQYYSGGTTFSNPAVDDIIRTTDNVLYRTERTSTSDLGSFAYNIPVPAAGNYTVTLHFAEIWFGAPGGEPGGSGKRVFSSNLEGGTTELVNFDIFAEAGAITAVKKTFTVPVTDGVLSIFFSASVNKPKLSAIEVVFPGPTPPPPTNNEVLRINAGGPAVTTGGVAWAADQYYSGGTTFSNPAVDDIIRTTDNVLYRTERTSTSDLGSFAYNIPVPAAGNYTVTLHFAEIWFGAPGGEPGGSGKRVFSSNLEGGTTELVNFDIFAEAGAITAVKKTFTVPVTDGVLSIFFSASVNKPKLSAIEVVFAGGSSGPASPGWPTSWQAGASAPAPCFEGAGLALGRLIYRFGGFDSQFRVLRSYSSYDPAKNAWTSLGTLPVGMAESHMGIAEDGTYIYLAGGFAGNLDTSKTPTQTVSNRVYRYDPATNTFLLIATLPQGRGAGALAALNGKLHYISGNPADRVTNVGDHFVYNLAQKTWSTAAPLPNPKDHMSCVVLNGKIFILGGEHGHDHLHEQQADCHSYDPASNTWTKISSLPLAKSHIEAGTFIFGSRIIMAGGQTDNFQPTSQVVAYDPGKNAWSVLQPLPAARQGAIVQRVDNKVVLALGAIQTNQPQSNVWLGTVQ